MRLSATNDMWGLTLNQFDTPLVHSTLNPIGPHDPRQRHSGGVKSDFLGLLRKLLHKLFNLLIYGRPTNTFLDRQKD